MVILKKIKSATLIEALVATVLIVIVFVVASLILNSLLLNSFKRNTHAVENRMTELEYQLQNKTIRLPYREEFKNWEIELNYEQKTNLQWLKTKAIHKNNGKTVIKTKLHAAN